jgi:hypothetical protein
MKMAIRKRHILLAALGVVLVLSLVSYSVLGSDYVGIARKAIIYTDYLGDNWRIVEQYGDVYGEKYVVAPSPYSTALIHQASTLGWNHAGPRFTFGYAFWGDSQKHEIEVRGYRQTPPPFQSQTDRPIWV